MEKMSVLLLLSLLLLRGHQSSSLFSSIYETSPNDIDGLKALANKFPMIELALDFGGDPCTGEAGTYWLWIECSTSTPPRITALNLANSVLVGELPDFSQMQALETIDFADNLLSGPIPDFLGQFPNLKRLDLSNNQFRGNIPRSILHKKNLNYSVEGNPDVHGPPKKKNLGLLIGLPLGLIFGLVILPGLVIFLLTGRKPTHPRPSQDMIGTVPANNNMESGSFQGISQQQLNNHPSVITSSSQGFDQLEVNELLQLHNSNINNSARSWS